MIPVPPIGPWQGKLWGRTRCIFSHNGVEIWEIEAKKGGYCSEHFHDSKWNRFIVYSGQLKVSIFLDNEKPTPVDETILGPNDCTDVPPKKWHTFEALEDVKGIEVYWTSLNPDDIIRRTQGGPKDE